MNTKLPVRPKFDTRLSIVIAEDEKRQLFAELDLVAVLALERSSEQRTQIFDHLPSNLRIVGRL